MDTHCDLETDEITFSELIEEVTGEKFEVIYTNSVLNDFYEDGSEI